MELRNNIKHRTICGESGDVRSDTDDSWKERLPELVEGFKAEDICNVDETRCFWRALPNKGLGQTKIKCMGDKKSKQRVTITIFVKVQDNLNLFLL